MRINNNIMALNAHRQLGANQANGAKSMERLSSGLRINRAGDDAAGLAISEKMRAQIRGLNQASRNSQDAISLIQTAEGALNETHSILQRMRELATQAANDTNVGVDRNEIQKEINNLTSEINRIGNTTEFNTQKLLTGEIAITDDGKILTDGSDDYSAGANLANITVDSDSSLDAGAYSLTVAKTSTNEISSEQVSSDVDTTKVYAQAVSTTLDEGSYRIALTSEESMGITGGAAGITGDTGILDTSGSNVPISVQANSPLNEAQHIIQVEKTVTQTYNEIDMNGITLTDATGGAIDTAGNYTISTNATLDTGNIQAAAALWTATDTGVITDLSLATNSTYTDAQDLEIQLVQSGTGAGVTGTGGYVAGTNFTDAANDTLVINNVNIDLTGLGDGSGSPAIGVTETNLQAAIDAVFDGTNHGGATYTVSNDGTNFTIVANDTNDTVDLAGSEVGATAGLGLGGTSAVAAAYDTTDNVTMEFRLVNGATGEMLENTTASFTNTSGSTSIKLGDFSFDVDNAAMYATDADATDGTAGSTLAGEAITFESAGGDSALAYDITVTADDGSYSTQTVAQSTTGNDVAFTLSDGTSTDQVVTLDYNSANFVGGSSYAVAVSNEASYDIKLYQDINGDDAVDVGDTQIGDTITLSGVDIQDSNNITNLQVGGAANGLAVDFSQSDLEALASGADEQILFTLAKDTNTTAVVQKADGTAVAGYGATTLDAGAAASTEISIGDGVSLVYEGVELAEGNIYFSVATTGVSFEMTLSDGADLSETKSFNEGETVDFTGQGVSIDTAVGVANGETANFAIEETEDDKSLSMQVGANMGQSFSVDISDMRAKALGVSGAEASGTANGVDEDTAAGANFVAAKNVTDGTTSTNAEYALDVSNHTNATAAVEVINQAIERVSGERSKLGAFQNRLEHTISNLGTSAENLQAAESRIRDLDMAQEMMSMTKNNILSQAATAMLAQANMAPQAVLQLLG